MSEPASVTNSRQEKTSSKPLWRSVRVFVLVLFFFATMNVADWLGERNHKSMYEVTVGIPFPMAGWGGPKRTATDDAMWFSPLGTCLNLVVALGSAGVVAWALWKPPNQANDPQNEEVWWPHT